jgi:hypothetical protein
MQRLLAEEVRATEIVRELRLRQLRLLVIGHQVHSGQTAGLPTMGGEDTKLDMMKRTTPHPSSYSGTPPTHAGDL